MSFPKGFTWGAAAASYQIEGAAREDGKGPSVWDMFCQREGKVFAGHTGDVACDHYHRYKEDVSLMSQIGLQAYRLSISWPRVIPAGTGEVNAAGLEFYDRLIDELLATGIQPWVTLFHWDYPYELYCRGGWLNPDSPKWFADYATVIAERLSDRVRHWMTINEPQCFIGFGHNTGENAPGDKLGMQEILRAAHHVLLAHGRGVQAIRAAAKSESIVGYAPFGGGHIPATDSKEDIAAARQMDEAVREDIAFDTRWWSDPAFLGQYPEEGLNRLAASMPEIGANDMETIAQPLDFYGVNIYWGDYVRAGAEGPEVVGPGVGHPQTAMGWAVTPEAMYWGPKHYHERYGKPVIITENGLACLDWVHTDGKVHDPQRIDLTQRYLTQLHRAIADGVDVSGYFHWSILDNFEWADGYAKRFGLIHVDYETQKRTPKDSARWYAEVIKTNGKIIDAS